MIIENTGGEQTVLATAKADLEKTFERQITKGMEKYGVVLKTFNGRDPGKDAFEELIDLSVYLEQLRMEHLALSEILYFILCDEDYSLPVKIVETLERMNENKSLGYIATKWGLKKNGRAL